MCLGQQPQAPRIEYVGPSDDDIRRNEQALANYQSQISDQQAAFQSQLQAQIDAANAETAALESRYAQDLSAARASGQKSINSAQAAGDQSIADATAAGAARAAAAGQAAAAQQVGALTVTTQQSEAEMPQTTESTVKKNKSIERKMLSSEKLIVFPHSPPVSPVLAAGSGSPQYVLNVCSLWYCNANSFHRFSAIAAFASRSKQVLKPFTSK